MRAYRPYIPIPTRIAVAERQFGLRGVRTYEQLLIALCFIFGGCDYHLDHDPPLASRHKALDQDGAFVDYEPPANSAEHLRYLAKDDHLTKTLVRGEHGQFSDRMLINRAKRRERREAISRDSSLTRPKATIRGLTFQQQRCRMGARCECDRRERKRCKHYRT